MSGEHEAAATRASRAMVLGIMMVTGVDRAVKVNCLLMYLSCI